MTEFKKTIKALVDYEDIQALDRTNAIGTLETIKGLVDMESQKEYAYIMYEDDNEMSQTLELYGTKESLKIEVDRLHNADPDSSASWDSIKGKLDTEWEVELDDYAKIQRLEIQ